MHVKFADYYNTHPRIYTNYDYQIQLVERIYTYFEQKLNLITILRIYSSFDSIN